MQQFMPMPESHSRTARPEVVAERWAEITDMTGAVAASIWSAEASAKGAGDGNAVRPSDRRRATLSEYSSTGDIAPDDLLHHRWFRRKWWIRVSIYALPTAYSRIYP